MLISLRHELVASAPSAVEIEAAGYLNAHSTEIANHPLNCSSMSFYTPSYYPSSSMQSHRSRNVTVLPSSPGPVMMTPMYGGSAAQQYYHPGVGMVYYGTNTVLGNGIGQQAMYQMPVQQPPIIVQSPTGYYPSQGYYGGHGPQVIYVPRRRYHKRRPRFLGYQ